MANIGGYITRGIGGGGKIVHFLLRGLEVIEYIHVDTEITEATTGRVSSLIEADGGVDTLIARL
jgi:hypothetical protein